HLKRIAEAARRMLELIDRIPDQLTGPSPAPPPAPARAARPAAADVPLPSEDGPGPATLALRAAVSKTRGESGGTLLVVDDNELNRDMLSRRLRSRGYEVVTAEDGQNALDLVKSRRFDLILLDIMMPVLSGLDVLKVIRATYSVAELPIIMATAKDQGTDVVEALRMGAN